MADLRTTFAGIESPNPFWLASGPPTNTYGQVAKAFDEGWGGAIWKTIGEPIINVYSRYGSVDLGKTRMVGFNNIELISDRPIEDNLKEIADVKRNYPKNAVIASLMVESKREAWHEIVKRTIDTGADALELINTINSIVSVDLETFSPRPSVHGKGSHGGYCGPAVKPIALHMLSSVTGDPQVKIPVSGIGGIATWTDAAEFIALGAGNVQVCTAAMHYGFRIVEDLADGLSNWMDERGYQRIEDFRGRAVGNVTKWEELDLNYHL